MKFRILLIVMLFFVFNNVQATENKIDGFIKVLSNNDEIIGAHIISEEASAMVQQFAIAMANKLSPKDLHKVIFAHPTYSEGVAESILGLDDMALHLPKKV